MKILVIQTAFIGDVVLTTPFFRAMRQKWPDSQIHVIATPQGCETLEGLEGVQTHPLDKRRVGLMEGLRKVQADLWAFEPFDLIFSVHRSMRSLVLGRMIRAKRRIAFGSVSARLLGYETVGYPAYHEDMHYADKPLALLSLFGGSKIERGRPELNVSEKELASFQQKRAQLKSECYAVISPFSVWGTKTWFADRFASVAAEIARTQNLGILIVGASQRSGVEESVGQAIAEKVVSSGGQALSLVGHTSIGELKAAIKGAKLLVANDSAPVHIAAAFDVPTVAIFGPTVKKWGFFPLASRAQVVERTDLKCRPCHHHGPPRCPKRHFRCMNEIQVEHVIKAVQDVL